MPGDDKAGHIHWLDVDQPTGVPDDVIQPPPRRRWPKWTPLLLALPVALIVALVVARQGGGRGHSSAQSPSTSPSASKSLHSTSPPRTSASPQDLFTTKPVVRNLGHPLLGVTGNWELFAHTNDSVIRVQLDRGRVTETPVPPLQSSGPVAFVATSAFALIHPLDVAQDYVVRDGGEAREAPSMFGSGGLVAPGPEPDRIWVHGGGADSSVMTLVDIYGHPTDTSMPVPGDSDWSLSPDGTGYLTFSGVGGVYDVRPGAIRRITTGTLIAVGPRAWLTIECDEAYRCSWVVVDTTTHARRTIGTADDISSIIATGTTSPDGSLAAVYRVVDRSTGEQGLSILDLRTGRERLLPVRLSRDAFSDVAVWSPDGKQLFAADATGRVRVVDTTTWQVSLLNLNLPAVLQLAIRPEK